MVFPLGGLYRSEGVPLIAAVPSPTLALTVI